MSRPLSNSNTSPFDCSSQPFKHTALTPSSIETTHLHHLETSGPSQARSIAQAISEELDTLHNAQDTHFEFAPE